MRKTGLSFLVSGLLVTQTALADATGDAIRQLQADMAALMQQVEALAA